MGVLRPFVLFSLAVALLPAQVLERPDFYVPLASPKTGSPTAEANSSQRYSQLTALTRDNVKNLELKWVYHPKYMEQDGGHAARRRRSFVHRANSEVVAFDAVTGRAFWTFHYAVPPESNAYVMVVKGLAISGDKLFLGDLRRAPDRYRREDRPRHLEQDDFRLAHGLPVQCRSTRRQRTCSSWVLRPRARHELLGCRLRRQDRAKSDGASTRRRVAGRSSVQDLGRGFRETWSSPIWVTGSYDPETNLTFWGTGNPNPGWNGDPRPETICTRIRSWLSDADTGKLKWHYQFRRTMSSIGTRCRFPSLRRSNGKASRAR